MTEGRRKELQRYRTESEKYKACVRHGMPEAEVREYEKRVRRLYDQLGEVTDNETAFIRRL